MQTISLICNISFSPNFLVWNFVKMEEADIEDIKVEQSAVICFFVRQRKSVKEHWMSYKNAYTASCSCRVVNSDKPVTELLIHSHDKPVKGLFIQLLHSLFCFTIPVLYVSIFFISCLLLGSGVQSHAALRQFFFNFLIGVFVFQIFYLINNFFEILFMFPRSFRENFSWKFPQKFLLYKFGTNFKPSQNFPKISQLFKNLHTLYVIKHFQVFTKISLC